MRQLRNALLRWYDENRRDLPWRATADPYHVWLSEIMLQQTLVTTVIPYFERFIDNWPSVIHLANAKDADVLACWAGLGYYARGRNLLKTARIIAHDYAGIFPDDEKSLRQLPGIGAYTGNAILAIAFDRPVIAYDVNVTRVLARWARVETMAPKLHHELRALEPVWLDANRAGDFLQGLMDFGARICRARAPDCANCPLASDCKGKDIAESLPLLAAKRPRPHCHALCVVFTDQHGSILLETRANSGMLGGMQGFLGSHWHYEGPDDLPEIAAIFPNAGDIVYQHCGAIDHGFTHYTLTMQVYFGCIDNRANWLPKNTQWMRTIDEQSLPTLMRKIWRKI